MRYFLQISLVLLTALLLTACNAQQDLNITERVFERSYELGDISVLDIDAAAGNIRLIPGKSDAVSVVLFTSHKATKRYEVETKTEPRVLSLKVRDKGTSEDAPGSGATLEITMPKRSFGHVGVRTGSGYIDFDKVEAQSLQVATRSGDITGTYMTGETLIADTGTGNLHLKEVTFNAVHASAGKGNLNLSLANMAAQVQVRIESGNADLYLPSDAQFELDARSHIGKASTNFDLPKPKDGILRGTVGTGNNLVTVKVVDGSLNINKSYY